jgi:hypothetical protein
MYKTFFMLCGVALLAVMACQTPPAPKPVAQQSSSGQDSVTSEPTLSAYLDVLFVSADAFKTVDLKKKTRIVYRYQLQARKLQLIGYSLSCTIPKGDTTCRPTLDPTTPIMTTESFTQSDIRLKDGDRLTSLVLRDKPLDKIVKAIKANGYKTILFVPERDTIPSSDYYKWVIYYSKDPMAKLRADGFLIDGLVRSDFDLNPAPPYGYSNDRDE